MRIDEDTKVYLWARDVTLDADPTGSSIELEVDNVRYAMIWQGTPVATGGTWKQTARSTYKFAGSTAPIAGTDVRLTSGRRSAKPVITLADGQVIPGSSVPLDVR